MLILSKMFKNMICMILVYTQNVYIPAKIIIFFKDGESFKTM